MELFTSEGCSSCPPADRVLAELAAQGGRVYALSFHVDYWDDLGWPDPFSLPAATARQRVYARTLHSDVYTPQLVVNGQAPFVGSNRAHARTRVDRALGTPATTAVEILALTRTGNRLTVTVAAPDAPEARVVVAVVEAARERRVTRGENAGHVLRHVDVVRAFETTRGPRGTVTLTLPSEMIAAGARVVAYAQHARTLAVLGATDRPLPAR